ncbi:MAG TPA: hypothetical protein DCS66_08785 [Flavobacteriaceae bacterium]|nr:hypothetical protein [Flavobacteriaceae bacterium]HAT64682.1 hypothetical protein [Flavobacteriaceae bacterium]
MYIKLKTAKKTAFTFFIIGTLLFFIRWVSGYEKSITLIVLAFILFAVIYNLIVLILLITQLIKHNELDSFFSMLIILLNIPIAAGYVYILIHFS